MAFRIFPKVCGIGALFGVALSPLVARAATTYYVAPTGSDSAAGSETAPWASMAHAQSVAAAGDTVLFRGGTYAFTAATSTCSSQTATVNAITLNKSGTSGNRIMYWAYPNETPVFDFSGIKDSCRITGIRLTGSYIHLRGLEIRGVPQNNTANHESWGVWISGSNNVFELLDLHDNMGPGLFIGDGGNNLVLNCDSHDNYDPNSSSGAGGNADGFGCHIGSSGTGNVFRGCRAWFNSDDGYDLIQAQVPVTFENSWAFDNGYRSGTTTASGGDGNGFKAGGYGKPPTNVPASPPQHVIRNCVAVHNRASGFYANHHPVANRWYNNTGLDNKSANFNMLGLDGSTDINVGILRNNVAFTGTAVSNGTGAMVDSAENSWDTSLGVSVSAADFTSTSATGWDAPRQADGSLPNLTSLHLATGSDLIDKGADVGLPFNGSKPDLGAFETGAPLGTGGAGGAGSGGGGAGGGTAGGASAGRGGASAGASAAGADATGGTDVGGSGGAAASGMGGTNDSGGSSVGGGAPATGGATSATGGTPGTSGSPSNGGASATGGSTAGRSASGAGSSGRPSASGGASSVAGTSTGAATGDGSESAASDDAGCGCRTSGQSAHGSVLGLFALLLVRVGRRTIRRRTDVISRDAE